MCLPHCVLDCAVIACCTFVCVFVDRWFAAGGACLYANACWFCVCLCVVLCGRLFGCASLVCLCMSLDGCMFDWCVCWVWFPCCVIVS